MGPKHIQHVYKTIIKASKFITLKHNTVARKQIFVISFYKYLKLWIILIHSQKKTVRFYCSLMHRIESPEVFGTDRVSIIPEL